MKKTLSGGLGWNFQLNQLLVKKLLGVVMLGGSLVNSDGVVTVNMALRHNFSTVLRLYFER